MSYPEFCKSRPIATADEMLRSVTGIACDETEDAQGEINDYESQVPYVRAWSDAALAVTTKAGIGPSRGNIRVQHDATRPGGIVKSIDYRDSDKEIWLTSQPTADTWPLIRDGVLTSYSIAGAYVRRWHGTCDTTIEKGNYCPYCMQTVPVRFCAKICEVSFCDLPANPNATFRMVRTNGAVELVKARGVTRMDRDRRSQRIALVEHAHDLHDGLNGDPDATPELRAAARDLCDSAELWVYESSPSAREDALTPLKSSIIFDSPTEVRPMPMLSRGAIFSNDYGTGEVVIPATDSIIFR